MFFYFHPSILQNIFELAPSTQELSITIGLFYSGQTVHGKLWAHTGEVESAPVRNEWKQIENGVSPVFGIFILLMNCTPLFVAWFCR